jgi:hypothetical protein
MSEEREEVVLASELRKCNFENGLMPELKRMLEPTPTAFC